MPSAAGRRSDLRFLIAALLHSDGARSTTDVSPYSASRQHVEVRLAHEPELLPGLTAIVALDKAERIGQFGTRRRVPAAVQRIARGGEAYGHLLSGDALLNKLKQYRMVETRWRLADSAPDPVLDVVGPDGALQFSSRHLHITTPDYAEEDATNAAAAQRAKRLKINQELLGQFEKLLLFLKNREVRVVLAQTPFHPAFLNGIKGSAYHEDLMRIEREINSIAARTGTTVVGSFDAVKEGCDRSDYRDFNHSSVRCLRRLVAQISDL
jgi:hypothetical protein